MADGSRNPQDQAELRKLEATLASMNEKLAAARAQGEQLLAKSDAVESRLQAIEQRAAKGELGAAEKLPRATPRATEEAPAVRSNAQAAEQRAVAEERATKATAERVRLSKAPLQLGPGQAQLGRTQTEPFPPQYNRYGGILSDQQRLAQERAASREAELAAQRQASTIGAFARPQDTTAREALGSRRVGDLEQSAQATQTAARAERAFGDSTAYSSRVLGQNAGTLTRNGALTTEFFRAAAKGQVTIRELGEQVGLTIAKFGGWTTAAAAVYGAVAAIRELGAGAIQSESGVQRLLRFLEPGQLNKARAQQGFRDTSREINVPIEDVAQAQAGFLRVYKDQDQALAGARVSLKATKLDNIAAADSVRYFTAIAQEFQLPVSRLPLLLDQVANGYRSLGANAADVVPALARSAAAVSNAGGSLTELVQITVAMRRLTGQTGLSIGTALSRSASNFITKPANQAIISSFGIDPKEGYTKLLRDAISKSKQLSGDDIRKLAVAIGGPQFGAKLFTALLRDRGDIVEKAGIAVAPKQAKGKADTELKAVLSQADEEISKIGNNLQRLGSALASSGALNDVLALVKLLNLTLDSTTRLIELFSRLAGPLAQPLFMLGEMYGVLRLLRRFDVGRYLPGAGAKEGEGTTAANFFRQPLGRRTNAEITQGLGYEKEAVNADLQSSSVAARRATRARLAAQDRYAAAVEAENVNSEAALAEEEKLVAARAKEREALAAQAKLVEEQALLETQTANYNALYGKRSSVLYRDAEGAAVASGIAYKSKDIEQGGAPVPIKGSKAAGAAAGETEAAAAAAVTSTAAMRKKLDVTDKELGKFASEGETTSSTIGKVKTVAGEAATAAVGLGDSLKASASRLATMKVGPLGALIAGFIAFEAVQHIVDESLKTTEQELARLEKSRNTADPQKLKDTANSVLHGRGGLHGILDDLQNTGADLINFAAPSGPNVSSPEQVRDRAAQDARREAESLAQAQGRGALLGTSQIRTNLDARLKASHSQKESLAAIDKAYEEMSHSYAATFGGKGSKDALRQLRLDIQVKAADIKAGGKDLNAIIESLTDAATLKTFAGETSARIEQHGPTKGNLRRAAAEIARAEELGATANGKELKDLATVQKQVEDEAVQAIQKQAQDITTYAGTPQEFHAATDVEIRKLRATLVGGTEARLSVLDKRTKDRKKQIDEAQRAADEATKKAAGIPRSGAFGPLGAVTIAPAGNEAAIRADADKKQRELADLEKAQRADNKTKKALRDGLARDRAKLRPLVLEAQKADFEFQQTEFSAQTDLLTAQTADPLVQAQITAARLHQQANQVAVAYRRHLVSHAALLTAIAAADRADQQAAQADVTRFQAQQGLATSQFALGTTNQGAILRNSIATAQAFLGKVRGLGNKLDPATVINATKAVVDAQIALRDYLKQQAQAMLQASEDLAKAGVEDPVQQAVITARYAKLALNQAKKAGDPAALKEAQAKYKQARHDEAKARQQDAFDTIEFDLQMGLIDQQTGIARLNALEKTVKGNKAFRRQIELEKHRLQQEINDTSKYDIDIGNIRLPTTYELRRLIAGGSQGVTVTNRNVVQVQVNDPGAVPAVARALDKYVSTSGSAARAMGLR